MVEGSNGGAAISAAIDAASEGKLVAANVNEPREPHSNMTTTTLSTLFALIRKLKAITSSGWVDRSAIERSTLESKSMAVFKYVSSIGLGFDANYHSWHNVLPALYSLSTPIEIIEAAIHHYGDENLKSQDTDGSCSLHHAAKCANREAVRLLLERVPSSIFVKNHHKETALVNAARKNSSECVKLIVEARTKAYQTNEGKSRIQDYGSALSATICIKCVQQLRIERPYHGSKTFQKGWMKAFSNAACGHHYGILTLLFEDKPPEADMQVAVTDSFSSIVYAGVVPPDGALSFSEDAMDTCLTLLRIVTECQLSVDMLICSPGSVVVSQVTMLTACFSTFALLSSLDRRHMQVVIDRLLEMGASVDGLSEDRRTPDMTPFYGACASLSRPLIDLLVKNGAKPDLDTVIHPLYPVVKHASEPDTSSGRQKEKQALEILDHVLDVLISGTDRRAEFVNRLAGGYPSLLRAALLKPLVPSLRVLKKLLSCGADPNVDKMLTYWLSSPPYAASEDQALKVCDLFFSYGASIAPNNIEYIIIDGWSPRVSEYIRQRHGWSSAQLLASATPDDDDTDARVVLRNRPLSFTTMPGTPSFRELCDGKPRLLACLEAAKAPFGAARNHFLFPLWHRQAVEAVLSSSVISRGVTRLPALPFEVWIIILRLL